MNKNEPLVLHTVIFHKPVYKTKEQARKEAHNMFPKEKLKTFVRETNQSFRFRVIPKQKFDNNTFVSKRLNKDITIVLGKKHKLTGGEISSDQVGQFIEASYKKKREAQNIDGYKLDQELSTKRSKVYYDPKTNKSIHVIAGTDRASDWANNLLIPLGLHKYSDRYKKAENTQKKAIEKYGKDNTALITHSQSGNIAENLTKKGLTGKDNITLNPAIIGKHDPNLQVIRSDKDIVSSLTKKGDKDITIKSKGSKYNPLTYITEHSPSILKRTKKMFGGSINPELMIYFNIYKEAHDAGGSPKKLDKERNNIIAKLDKLRGVLPSDIKNILKLIDKYRKENPIQKKTKTQSEKKQVSEEKKKAKEEAKALKFPSYFTDEEKKRYLSAERYIKKVMKDGKFKEIGIKLNGEENEEYKNEVISDLSREYAETPEYKRMSENIIHIILDDGLQKPAKPPPKPKAPKKPKAEVPKKSNKKDNNLKKGINDLLTNISKTNISKNIDFNEGNEILKKIDIIQKEEQTKNKKADDFRKKQLLKKSFKLIKEDKKPETPFDIDKFKDINGFEILIYKKNYYLRDLETSEIYSIRNNKPFQKVGLYKIVKGKPKIILDKKPEIPVILQIEKPPKGQKSKEELKKIADDFRRKQLLKKTFKSIKSNVNKDKILKKKEINDIIKEIENFEIKEKNNIDIKEANELINNIENKLNLPKPIPTKESTNNLINGLQNRFNMIQKIGKKYEETPLKYSGLSQFTLFGYLYLIDKYKLPNILFGLKEKDESLYFKDEFNRFSYSLELEKGNKFDDDNNDIKIRNYYEINNFYDIFFNTLKLFIDQGEELIFIPLSLNTGLEIHANMLIYRVNENKIERFEPHGIGFKTTDSEFTSLFNDGINNKLKYLFEEVGIKYLGNDTPTFSMIIPLNNLGFQAYESLLKKHINDGKGYCQLWSLFFMELVALNKDISSNKLMDNSIEIGEASSKYFTDVIRGYVSIIYKEMNNFLKKIKKDYNINFEIEDIDKQKSNKDLLDYFYKLKEDFKLKPKINIELRKQRRKNVSKQFLEDIKNMSYEDLKEEYENTNDSFNEKITKAKRNQLINESEYLRKLLNELETSKEKPKEKPKQDPLKDLQDYMTKNKIKFKNEPVKDKTIEINAKANWRKKYKKERDEMMDLEEKINDLINKKGKKLNPDFFKIIIEEFNKAASNYMYDSELLTSDFEKHKKAYNNIINLFPKTKK